MADAPLSVLDLVPVSSGSDVAHAVRNTVDLARRTEEFGYHRYWFAEHHLNPGVAGASPPVLIALVAGATERIRLGSAGVQLAHRTPLAVVEEFGLLDALHPGRLDLGLGRSGKQLVREYATAAPRPAPAQAANGLLIPAKPDFGSLARSSRLGLAFGLLQQPGAESPGYAEQVDDILALLRGTYRSAEGLEAHAVPGEGARPQVWILGSSGGQSASVAGHNSLRFAANYHVSPSSVLEAVDAYRQAFRPSDELPRPHIAVSADVVVAEDDAAARELASGYALWVRSIRRAEGAIRFPTPEEAAAHEWSDEDRAIVADRVDTQFVGSAATVAARLRQLQEATGADELVVTTITHAHADRVRSYELLAEHWNR
ncbi:LLM class flavin-dependent oxidoreductase [Amycolatopsis sp. CA-126428]|uniref:LLM class flavin-dependent oxidoreductase n=1 Tax=Amycolatopsis sp. CA-126428 TaxID=2073158 RepID=UPI000CD1DDEB|nr:LLM class flavin-dependent oxidoreductase [Amycolatopsis sp. CA-126428]